MSGPDVRHKPHPKNKFTAEEDIFLRKLVAQFGENNWQQVARHMEHRNSRQCKERWTNYLSPMVRNTPWKPEEDELLLAKVRELGKRWVRIAKFFPMRTDINIKNRWLVLKRRRGKNTDLPPLIPDLQKVNNRIPSDKPMEWHPLPFRKVPLPLKKVGVIQLPLSPPNSAPQIASEIHHLPSLQAPGRPTS